MHSSIRFSRQLVPLVALVVSSALLAASCEAAPGSPGANPGSDGGATGGGPLDGGAGDGGEPDAGPTIEPLNCQPNRDGRLEASELDVRAGLRVPVHFDEDVTVDLAGVPLADGGLRFALATAYAGTQARVSETISPAGRWFEGAFPDADYVSQLIAAVPMHLVFDGTDAGLIMLGAVSLDPDSARTELHYATPIPLVRFPLRLGDSWQTTSQVSGTALGAPTTFTETWTFAVQKAGVVDLPGGSHPVMRLSILAERTLSLVTTRYAMALFIAECDGVVALASSQSGSQQAEFTDAAELYRLRR